MGAITTEVVDDGEKRDVRGRRMMARARRLELIEAYRASGLTMAEFTRRESLNYTTFVGWMSKQGGPREAGSPIKFAEVKLASVRQAAAPLGTQLEVRLRDGTVVAGGTPAQMAEVMRALRS